MHRNVPPSRILGGEDITATQISTESEPGSAALTLSVNRRIGTAPAGFFLSAKASGFDVEDPYFDLRYKWSFGDPGHYTRHDTADLPWGKYYKVGDQAVLIEDGTTPAGSTFLGNDKNVAFGPHVVHVFEKPGRYTITCEVQKRGQASVQQTLQIEVEDPDVVFAGANTICVSASGDFTGAPAGAVQVRSFAQAMQRIRRSKSANQRVLFRRGERHATPTDRRERDPGAKNLPHRLHWGAFGTGGPPVYGPHNIFLNAKPSGEACVWGLNYEGPYRASDPWGASPLGKGGLSMKGAAFTTVWDCRLQGGKTLATISRGATDIVIANSYGTDWHDYGIFANRGIGRVGLAGVWLKQNDGAVIGGEGKGEKQAPFYQDHAPFRCSSLSGPVAFNLCDLRSIGSWAGYYQPCLRIGRSPNGSGLLIEEAVMDRIRGENDGMLGTGNSGHIAYPRRYLWDKIYLVAANEAGGTKSLFNLGVSGLCFRNVMVVLADTPRIGGGRIDHWIRRSKSGKTRDDALIGKLGVSLYNATLVDLRSPSNYQGKMKLYDPANLDAFGFVRVENNIVHVPNRKDPSETKDDPLSTAIMWHVTNTGLRYRDDPFAAIFATASDAAAYYRPEPGSAAFADASGPLVAVDDFFGRVRGAKTSRGAIAAET